MMRMLVVLGRGGHTTQMIRLLELLGSEGLDFSYLLADDDTTSGQQVPFPGEMYRVPIPLGKYQHQRGLLRAARAGLAQIPVLWHVRPQVILTNGANIAIPICVLGKLLGCRIIYVETASRVWSLSATGRFMYRLADQFFVQWEELLTHYPRAVFAGRLL